MDLLPGHAEPAQEILIAPAAAVGGLDLLLQGIGTVTGFLVPQVQLGLHPLTDLLPRLLGQGRGHLLGLLGGILGPQAVIIGVEFPLQLAQNAGGLARQPPVSRGSGHHPALRGNGGVGVLAHPGQRALDTGTIQVVQHILYGDIAGQIPQPGIPLALEPEMAEYAVEYRVQIQPIEIFWVLLVKPQQGAGLIIKVHAVCGQHAAPLVRYRGQGTERHIQKAEVKVQPAAHHGQHLAAHPGLPLLVGLWPFGCKGLAGVEEFFFFRNQNHTSASSGRNPSFCALRRPAAPQQLRCLPWRQAPRPQQRQ